MPFCSVFLEHFFLPPSPCSVPKLFLIIRVQTQITMRNEAIAMSNIAFAMFGWMGGFTTFVLVLCSINTLLLLQLFAEFLQDPESSSIVEFASPNNATVPASISTCSAPLSHLPSLSLSLANWTILWHAPFFSGGGYCSEAWSYYYLLQAMGADVRVVQHGDGVDNIYASQMNHDQKHAAAASHRPINRRIISICHSEPGAWSAPSPRFQTSRCPHPLAEVAVGRTMFETDRLPHGWAERLLHMHRVRVFSALSPLLYPPSFAHTSTQDRCGFQPRFITAYSLRRATMRWPRGFECYLRL